MPASKQIGGFYILVAAQSVRNIKYIIIVFYISILISHLIKKCLVVSHLNYSVHIYFALPSECR